MDDGKQPKATMISVSDPMKPESKTGYVTYKITCNSTLENFLSSKGQETTVVRRFSDFYYLYKLLQRLYKGIIVPPCPEKDQKGKMMNQDEFIDIRRAALDVFINKVVDHPVLMKSEEVRIFLEATEAEWLAEKKRRQEVDSGQTGKKIGGFFKGLLHSTKNTMKSVSDDQEEDPEYLKTRLFYDQLEDKLITTHEEAGNLVARIEKESAALRSFGTCTGQLSKFESANLETSITSLNEKCVELADLQVEHARKLRIAFEAPLKELKRSVRSVKVVINDRSDALANLQMKREAADVKRKHLQQLQDPNRPGVVQEKLAAAESDVLTGNRLMEEAAKSYEDLKDKMNTEIVRFQKEESSELQNVFKKFAIEQARMANQSAQIWKDVLDNVK